ncbi:hypothetical protein MNB_SM-3-374 [hydrothermal vent metagenome]|uniref:Uncharacterized protein n=1 Tax=hydrothermal vent metagenome TaxID=652676 RepID=A0A1W1D426_9ZZZZ
MARYKKNSKKQNFLNSIPIISLEDATNDLTLRCKFNFSYFIVDSAGQDFKDWSQNELSKLFDKLKEYSKFSLSHWENQKVGNYPVFVKYDYFPKNTDFTKPKHVPHQAIWSRFHIENKKRLIGFVIPDEYHDMIHQKTSKRFDTNTFYVVFLDKEHKFYKVSN